jgi:hypothetical protein
VPGCTDRANEPYAIYHRNWKYNCDPTVNEPQAVPCPHEAKEGSLLLMNHAPAQQHAPTDRGKGATTHETRPHAPAYTKLFTHDRAPCSEENTATSKQHQVQFGLVTFSDNDEDAITKQLKMIV